MAKKSRGEPSPPDPDLQRAAGNVEPHVDESLRERLVERADPLVRRFERPVARVSVWAKWVKALRPYRVYINY